MQQHPDRDRYGACPPSCPDCARGRRVYREHTPIQLPPGDAPDRGDGPGPGPEPDRVEG
jgi:hypothetical protein